MPFPINIVSIIKTTCLTIIVSVTVYLLYSSGQRLVNPVVGKLTIVKTERVSEDTTRIWVEFEKLRECRPLEVYWYIGQRSGIFDRVLFQAEKPLGSAHYVNRAVGIQRSGPWLVGIPEEKLKYEAFSDAQHDCWPFWTTVSRFYN